MMEKHCPDCGSEHTVKNGTIHNGKPKRMCKECGRQYTLGATKKSISDETWEMVFRMLEENISIMAIHRVTGISTSWLHVKIEEWANQGDERIEPPEDLDEKKSAHPPVR